MKHAFCIVQHDFPDVLDRLIKELNHTDIKFFIHIDKKAKFNVNKFINNHQSKNVVFIKSQRVYWGTYSQIRVILKLLETAKKEEFDYFHLLYGPTLPIKSLDYILKFYESNKGKEFVNVHSMHDSPQFIDRFTKLHLLPVRESFMKHRIFSFLNRYITRIKRNISPKDPFYYKLSFSWFSITSDFCTYLLEQKKWIHKKFKFGFCCDEVYLATLLFHSKFKNNIYNKSLTYVDFDDKYKSKGPTPCILTEKYINDLKASDCLYARKFDSTYTSFYYKLK